MAIEHPINEEVAGPFPGAPSRVHVERSRLRQLYQQDVVPRLATHNLPAYKLLLLVSLLMLAFFSATLLFKFNVFIGLQEDVLAARGHLEGAYQRRVNLFENLLKLTLNHAALEHEVFSHVADVRREIVDKIELPPQVQRALSVSLNQPGAGGIKDLGKALSDLSNSGAASSMGRLLGLVEQYPDIKSSETYLQLMHSLVQIEDRISTRRAEYQIRIQTFNREISRFPWYLLAKTTGFGRFDYFQAEEGSHVRQAIHSDVFEQLLPVKAESYGPVKNLNIKKAAPEATLSPDAGSETSGQALPDGE